VVDGFGADGAAYAHDDMVQCGWEEFVAARTRFFAQLAAQSVTNGRGLSAPREQGYDRDPAEHRQESRSR
jgi:hypothetical protein